MARRGRPPYPDVLTPREWEVLDLLRTGLSNPEIAERLGISRDGAKYHVSEILSKLGVSSREEASVWSSGERRPWWMSIFAPMGFVFRKTGRLIAVGVLVAAGAGIAFLAVLLACSNSNDETAVGVHQLAYIDADGALMLYDADSGEKRKVADRACGQGNLQGHFLHLAWSPNGQVVSCLDSAAGTITLIDGDTGSVIRMTDVRPQGQLYWSPSADSFVYVVTESLNCATCHGIADGISIYDSSGREVQHMQATAGTSGGASWAAWGWPLWSPDGTELAYRSAGEGNLHFVSPDLSQESASNSTYLPVAWVLDGTELIAESTQGGRKFVTSSRYRLDHTLSQLDSGVQFWVAPGGEKVVYLIPGFAPVEGGTVPGLGILDLLSGESTPIEGSMITAGTDHIPQEWVTFSEDGQYVYWLGGDNAGYGAKMDGSGLTKITQVEYGNDAAWSPDHAMIAYSGFGALTVQKNDGTNRKALVTYKGGHSVSIDMRLPFAWRPAAASTP